MKTVEMICAILCAYLQERLWKKYAKDAHLIDVTCNVAYEIQGTSLSALIYTVYACLLCEWSVQYSTMHA